MKKHLLLIHEDKGELKAFMEIVNNCSGSFKCTYASSGAQALEMLHYLEPDFIFINYHLADINALQLVSAIRYEQKHVNARLYLYANEISEEASKMARLLGASGCIEKTNDLHESVAELSTELKPILKS